MGPEPWDPYYIPPVYSMCSLQAPRIPLKDLRAHIRGPYLLATLEVSSVGIGRAGCACEICGPSCPLSMQKGAERFVCLV